MNKHLTITVGLVAICSLSQAVVYNLDDTDRLIVEFRDRTMTSTWLNSSNPFGDQTTWYLRSMIKITGGPTGTWRVENIGRENSQFNRFSHDLDSNDDGIDDIPWQGSNMVSGMVDPQVFPGTTVRFVGGIGLSSHGKHPNGTTMSGSWTKLVEATTAELAGTNLTSSSFPADNRANIWVVDIKANSGYQNIAFAAPVPSQGVTWDTHGPRWPMNQDRFRKNKEGNNAPDPQDFHAAGGGINGNTAPDWTDQPIVASLDFLDTGTYHRGVQLHFAKSGDYYLPSENVPKHPNPWHHSATAGNETNTLVTEEAVPGISGTLDWATLQNLSATEPSDIRCDLFDGADWRPYNFGVRKIEPIGGGQQKITLNANRQSEGTTTWNTKTRYRLLNAPHFLRHPGQMYYHSKSGKLFFIPYKQPTSTDRIQVLNVSLPNPYRNLKEQTFVDKAPDALITFEGCQNFSLYQFQFDTVHAMALKMFNTRRIMIESCIFRNLGSAALQSRNNEDALVNGQWANMAGFVNNYIHNSYKCAIDHYDDRWNPFYLSGDPQHQAFACGFSTNLLYTGNTISLELAPASVRPAWMQNVVTHTYGSTSGQHHETLRSYGQLYPLTPAFDLRGNSRDLLVEGNNFSDGAGAAIWGHGHRGTYRSNTFDSVVRDLTDSGAIYFGREPTSLANMIEDNIFYHILRDYGDYQNLTGFPIPYVAGVMLDDGMWRQTVRNNQFNNVDVGITINAGRLNLLERNKFNMINQYMLKMDGSVTAGNDVTKDNFLTRTYQEAKKCCGTAPFNVVGDPNFLNFSSTPWNWYKTTGAATQAWPNDKGTQLKMDDLEELNRMRGSSFANWQASMGSVGLGWLDNFGKDPNECQLIVYGTTVDDRRILGFRNVFLYADSDFGIVPQDERNRLDAFFTAGGSTVGNLFEMGYNSLNPASANASTPPQYRFTPNGTLTSFRKFMYGRKVTAP